jgi:hypothetical protein
MKKLIAAAAIVAAGVSVGGTAFAGEVNGSGAHGNPAKGNETPVAGDVASSVCSFSGLEDGEEGEQPYAPGNTQGWGQIVSGTAKADGGVSGSVDLIHQFGPGASCRGNLPSGG